MTGRKPKSGESDNSDILTAIRELDEKFSTKLENLEERIVTGFKLMITNEIETVKAEFKSCLAKLESRVNVMEEKLNGVTKDDKNRAISVIVRNLPESEGENVNNKVKSLIHDGLKLKNINAHKVTRKASYRQNSPGVIVVQCASKQDKAGLRNVAQYKSVYIEHDKSIEQRHFEANMRTLVNTIAKDKLQVRGPRIVSKQTQNRNSGHNKTNGDNPH